MFDLYFRDADTSWRQIQNEFGIYVLSSSSGNLLIGQILNIEYLWWFLFLCSFNWEKNLIGKTIKCWPIKLFFSLLVLTTWKKHHNKYYTIFGIHNSKFGVFRNQRKIYHGLFQSFWPDLVSECTLKIHISPKGHYWRFYGILLWYF